MALASLTEVYDLSSLDKMIGELRQANVKGLEEKYMQDVDRADDLQWFCSELRFGTLLREHYYQNGKTQVAFNSSSEFRTRKLPIFRQRLNAKLSSSK